jgi:hypothetical protein
MKNSTRRYLITIGCFILGFLTFGMILGIMLTIASPGSPRDISLPPIVGVIFTVIFYGCWITGAVFIAREKGRTWFWGIASMIAPLMLVLVLLPHTKERRMALDGKITGTIGAEGAQK